MVKGDLVVKLYLNGKHIASMRDIMIDSKNHCRVYGFYYHKELGNFRFSDMNGGDIHFSDGILKNCVINHAHGAYRIQDNDGSISCGMNVVDLNFLELIEQDDHSGQTYNAYTDTWSWL